MLPTEISNLFKHFFQRNIIFFKVLFNLDKTIFNSALFSLQFLQLLSYNVILLVLYFSGSLVFDVLNLVFNQFFVLMQLHFQVNQCVNTRNGLLEKFIIDRINFSYYHGWSSFRYLWLLINLWRNLWLLVGICYIRLLVRISNLLRLRPLWLLLLVLVLLGHLLLAPSLRRRSDWYRINRRPNYWRLSANNRD